MAEKINIDDVIDFLASELMMVPEDLTKEEKNRFQYENTRNEFIKNAIDCLYNCKADLESLKDCEVDILENKDASKFRRITREMLALYLLKNKNYGNSFSEQFSEYGLTSSCIRLEDKLRRIKTINKQLENREKTNTDDESIRDSLVDLANYAILTVIELDREGK